MVLFADIHEPMTFNCLRSDLDYTASYTALCNYNYCATRVVFYMPAFKLSKQCTMSLIYYSVPKLSLCLVDK